MNGISSFHVLDVIAFIHVFHLKSGARRLRWILTFSAFFGGSGSNGTDRRLDLRDQLT